MKKLRHQKHRQTSPDPLEVAVSAQNANESAQLLSNRFNDEDKNEMGGEANASSSFNKLSATDDNDKPESSSFNVGDDVANVFNDHSDKVNIDADTNLNHDDIIEINELSSIDSLLIQMPIDKILKKKEGYFSKARKNLRFYFKVLKAIIFNINPIEIESTKKSAASVDIDDVQNASFIYYSNFLIGLGIITVSYFYLSLSLSHSIIEKRIKKNKIFSIIIIFILRISLASTKTEFYRGQIQAPKKSGYLSNQTKTPNQLTQTIWTTKIINKSSRNPSLQALTTRRVRRQRQTIIRRI